MYNSPGDSEIAGASRNEQFHCVEHQNGKKQKHVQGCVGM